MDAAACPLPVVLPDPFPLDLGEDLLVFVRLDRGQQTKLYGQHWHMVL